MGDNYFFKPVHPDTWMEILGIGQAFGFDVRNGYYCKQNNKYVLKLEEKCSCSSTNVYDALTLTVETHNRTKPLRQVVQFFTYWCEMHRKEDEIVEELLKDLTLDNWYEKYQTYLSEQYVLIRCNPHPYSSHTYVKMNGKRNDPSWWYRQTYRS